MTAKSALKTICRLKKVDEIRVVFTKDFEHYNKNGLFYREAALTYQLM